MTEVTQDMKMNIQERKRARRLSINNRELLIAATDNDLKKIDNLIEVGVDVNFKDRDGNTSLHWAVESGDVKVVEALLLKGASANTNNNSNETPIDIGKRVKRQDIIKILQSSLEPKPASISKFEKLPNKLELECEQSRYFTLKQQINNTQFDIESKRERRLNPVHGNIYQLKVLMLFLYRAVTNKYSFRLGTEIKEAKKFDDLVFEYIKDGIKVYRLLQAKHRLDEMKKINAASLLAENDGDYSLVKYFFSYQELKKEKLFKGGLIKDVTICTNIDFDFENLKNSKIEIEKMLDKDEILDVKSIIKKPARYKFRENIIRLLKSKIQSYSLVKFSRTSNYSDSDIKDFLNHLVFAVNQPNEEELGGIVKNEISKEFDFLTAENVYNKFFMTMLNWLQGKERGMFLSYEEGKEFFEEINRGILFWFGVRIPVESFTGRVKVLDDLHRTLCEKDKHMKIVCVSGLGGVGKTELARKYVSQYSQDYDNKVIWINAESYESLADSFRRLACDQLRIRTKNADDEEKKISSIVEDVYTFFSAGKCLFVFDNAEKFKSQGEFDNGIEKFLPSLPADRNQLRVLITSRNQKWPKHVKVIPLSGFNEEEAVKFINKSLNLKDNACNKDIKTLANELQLFPLAMQQAVAYIRTSNEKMRNVGSTFQISDYLEKCKEKAKEFLNFKFEEDNDNDYAKTIYSTWNVTLDMIKQKENGNDACEILEVLSYFAPIDIPASTIVSLVEDETKLASSIQLLKQYSMVYVQNATISLHRLVLKVTRLNLQDQGKEEEVLRKALKLFNESNLNLENVDHAISVWNYSSKYYKLIEEFVGLSICISWKILESDRFEEVQSFGLKLSKLLSALPSKNLKITESLLKTENIIAVALLSQGKYSTALEHFQEIHKKQERLFGPNSLETLNSQDNIASILIKQNKLKHALKLCEEIIMVKENVLGKYHLSTLSTKRDIAKIFVRQGSYNKALLILQEILNIQETILENKDYQILLTKKSIADVLTRLGKYNEALKILQELQKLGSNKDYLETKFDIAATLLQQGKYNEALKNYREVYEGEKEVFGENHPYILKCRRCIGETLYRLGEFNESLKINQQVFEVQKHTLGLDHPDTLLTQISIAHVFRDQARDSEALELYQEVLKRSKVVFGNEHPDTLTTINAIAIVLSNQDKDDEALQYYQEILKIQERILGKDHSEVFATKGNIAISLNKKKQYDKALKILREIINAQQASGQIHADISSIKYTMAQALCGKKKYDEALQIYKEALDAVETISGKRNYRNITLIKERIANILMTQGKFNLALKVWRELSKMVDEEFGPTSDDSVKLRKFIERVSSIANNLLNAVKINDLRELKNWMLDAGRGVNTADDDDITLLHHAVNKGNTSMVKTLIESGADVTLVSNKGNTPLHIAVLKGDIRITEMLLQHVSSEKFNDFVNAKTFGSGASALHVAAKKNSLDITKSILKYGAIYNVKNHKGETPFDTSTRDGNVSRALKMIENLFKDAMSGDDAAIVEKIKEMEPDEFFAVIKARDSQGKTLLQVATVNNHADIARKLLEIIKKRY